MPEILLEVRDLVKHFPTGGGFFSRGKKKVHAVNGVSFQVPKGKTLGIVGESGCGKTTLGLALLRLVESDSGAIHFAGHDITKLSQREFRAARARMQMVFQDPFSSLNPRMRVGEIIAEPLVIHHKGNRAERKAEVQALLDRVGLHAEDAHKYPHEFSGGQRQRIGIARAIALKPDLIIADEPVSALDVSIQGEILNLLKDLQEQYRLTYVFISHDLKVVSQMSDRIAVMYLGKIVEEFPADQLHSVRHPYTQALLKAVPLPDPRRKQIIEPLKGDVPSPIVLPTGCAFHPRCPYAEDLCRRVEPLLEPKNGPTHTAACHLTDKISKLSIFA